IDGKPESGVLGLVRRRRFAIDVDDRDGLPRPLKLAEVFFHGAVVHRPSGERHWSKDQEKQTVAHCNLLGVERTHRVRVNRYLQTVFRPYCEGAEKSVRCRIVRIAFTASSPRSTQLAVARTFLDSFLSVMALARLF